MHVKITGFKIHIEAEYFFENNKMTLIKGQSGHGKSTILQAIFWALYGNMRSIYNNMRITKNLSVTLTLQGITIFRKKNPDLLTITIAAIENGKIVEKQYSDSIAQNIIDKRFGNRDVWKACSYIQQQDMCSLLTGTAKDRMAILNALSFSNENPREYIDKINEQYKDIKLEFEKLQAVLNSEIDTFSKELIERPVKYRPKPGDLEDINLEIKNTEKEIESLKEQLLIQQKYISNISYIQESIKALESELFRTNSNYKIKYDGKSFRSYTSIPKPFLKQLFIEKEVKVPEPQIAEYENQIQILEKHLEETKTSILKLEEEIQLVHKNLYIETPPPVLNNVQIISNGEYYSKKNLFNEKVKFKEQSVKKLNSTILPPFTQNIEYDNIIRDDGQNVNEQTIWNVEREESEKIKNEDLSNKLGIQYDEISIAETIKNYSYQLNFYLKLEQLVPNIKQLLNIQEQIESVQSINEKQNIEKQKDIESMLREKASYISELRKGLEVLQCPSCKTSLRYKNGVLHSENIQPATEEDIQNQEAEYSKLSYLLETQKKHISLCKSYEEEKGKLDLLLDKKEITYNALEDFYKNISQYSSLINDTRNYINSLSQIKFIKPGKYTSSFLKQVLKYKNDKITWERIEAEISKLKSDIQNVEKEIEGMEIEKVEALYIKEEERVKNNNLCMSQWQALEKERLGKIREIEYKRETLRKSREDTVKKIEICKEQIRVEKERVIKQLKDMENENKKIREANENIKLENENLLRNYEEREKQNVILWEKEKNEYEFQKEKMLNDIQVLEKRIESEREKIKELSQKLDKNIEISLKEREKKIIDDKLKINDIIYSQKMLEKETLLSEKRNKLMELYNDMIALDKLKTNAINVECEQLEDTVDNINLMLENTLSIFFPDPITFKLSLYKKLKKKGGGTKPGLNIEITYKGCKHENISNLSGGEISRISLALLLALNFVSNSPMILLDECVASLDGELKESCITGIKAIPNKTIICVDHDETMEGFYDAVIGL